MTSNDFDMDVENLRDAITGHDWRKVLKMYEEKRELRTAKVTAKGDTALHEAVFWSKGHVVESMVDLVCGERINEQDKGSLVDENGQEKNLVLGAQNEEGNTPLHLAASKWSVEICEKISYADPLLIAKRNHAGETPLFLAALRGNEKSFLCLHFQYMGCPEVSSTDIAHCIKRDNQDTILHCALEEKHTDLAIDIVLLYKDHLEEMTRMRNRNGLSPLHLLAEAPSLFKSNDLLYRSPIVRLLYHLPFVRVKKKKAPTRDGLEQDEHTECLWDLSFALAGYFFDFVDDDEVYSCWSWAKLMVFFLLIPLFLLVMIPLALPLVAEYWFVKTRAMKEKHIWSLQILEELLQHASDEDVEKIRYEEDNEAAGSKIVDTPLMIATKNGMTEMVEKILRKFPMTIKVVNEEEKNVVLLAAEMRQTKVYQILCQREDVDYGAFSQVDKDGNTALHLAAKPGVNLNWQTTTMVEEFKWFEFVKNSVPSGLWEKYNNDGKTAEEIFRESYKEHITSDRQWLNQTSQTCSLASTLVASMAFSSIVADSFNEKNYWSILALSLSLTSTICFLAILAFRSHSVNFWRYVPFMLQLAILFMFGSIVALWISLMFNGKALTAYAILGSPIAIFTIVSLPIFIGPTLMSMFTKVPPPIYNATSAIRYRRPKKKEDVTDVNGNQEAASHLIFRANNSLQNIGRPTTQLKITRSHTF